MKTHQTWTIAIAASLLASTQSACSMAVVRSSPPSATIDPISSGAPLCRVTSLPFMASGQPSRPYPPDGVIAFVDDGDHLKMVFNARSPMGRQCVAVDLATQRQEIAASSLEREACGRLGKPRSPVTATSDAETMLAWDAARGDQSDLFVGVVVYDLPLPGFAARAHEHVIAHEFALPAGGLEGSPSDPDLADIGGEHFFLSWTQGSIEKAQLRAQPVAAWGEAMGPAMDLSPPESSVMGTASAAFSRNGSGVVAYFASAGDAIELMATPVYCSGSPQVPGESQIARNR
jgi:hypothetical protein